MAGAGGRVAVVTGGSAGVGRAVVRALAADGCDVAVLARGRTGLRAAVAEVEAAGRRGLALQTDVADAKAVEEAADRAEEGLGPVDVWVNCAFAGFLAPFTEVDDEEFRRVTDVTYHGQVNGTRAALRLMGPRDRGVVVNVGSALSGRGIPLQSAYCGAKHAVVGFTEAVRTELEHRRSGVRICGVQLPGMNTPQFTWVLNRMPGRPQPVPPIYQPEVAARAVVFLARHPRRNAWVGVSTAYTLLGNRVAPWLADRYLARTGFASQQTGEDTPVRPANLFAPSDEHEDAGAHGPFDDRAHGHDAWGWASRHRTVLACAGVVACGLSALGGPLRSGARRR
ncbi:SDR family oxidoreductase [Streptacidiphilus sp. ASG 303]|uniref:SDR family oxidoreductase n=1 Tax=Streptacidiphilus sp. ASG 303 TaxID=2896847 RepID=UPI001E45928D|nr:SDR family oxidoreductase [Streptacidiphilus sp. ASG 303]MCD0484882.1 SDR family oxidoreductase [Streptacidiphilus sp. ASG 303]